MSDNESLPVAENTVIRAHIVEGASPGWWGPLIRVGGRYQSIEGHPRFTDSQIVEFEVLAVAVSVPSTEKGT